MSLFPLKPTSTYVKAYYAALSKFEKFGHTTEGNTRSAFADLLRRGCPPYGWHLVEEYPFRGTGKQSLRADGALVDDLTLVHGLWEAKDSSDDLKKEIKKKVADGYPLTNILFQSPNHAILYQDSRIAFDGSIEKADGLIEVLQMFFDHRQPHEVDWEEAVTKFAEKIPDLAGGVTAILEKEQAKNSAFRENFQAFAELCRQSVNPELDDDAIRKMLVQHLLTERIFRKVFNNSEFLTRNVIAVEIEKVIRSITNKHFSRDEFLKPLDRFYTAIEKAAESQEGYTEKQHFLNAVYEKFFQSFDTKQADTHGIVYTPQPIVNFMVRSVEEILHKDFGKSLSDSGVHILDPFTGTGNFITRVMQEIKRSALPQKYAEELHCNEIMLLPYYIASMNIEHAYLERVGEYRPFEGICLVDTFELSEFGQQSFAFTDSNTQRVHRQKKAPIFVIIGNPPYNVGQLNENDQNKNRKYKHWNNRIQETYAKDSKATLLSKLSDPYVKAFRWASDRIRNDGVIAYVTNNSYIDQIAFDGMRYHLARDFSKLYILDLGGNVRQNPKLSGTTHNVFGIQVGVSICLLIKKHIDDKNSAGEGIFYARMPEEWKRGQKYIQLDKWESTDHIKWLHLKPDSLNTWLTAGQQSDFHGMIPLTNGLHGESIFAKRTLGISTNRDAVVYSASLYTLSSRVKKFIADYNREVRRYQESDDKKNLDSFLDYTHIKWSRNLKRHLTGHDLAKYTEDSIRSALYRPFNQRYIYLADILVDEPSRSGDWSDFNRNVFICVSGAASAQPFQTLACRLPFSLDLLEKTQSFPFFTYNEDDTNQHENITDWALEEFRSHYKDKKITKWDIFWAVYAVLHHPEYRTRYAANLKRELPRIPFPPDFHAFAKAGKRLMELHVEYEKQKPYKLEQIEDENAEVSFRAEKMKLSNDKTELRYNDFITLRGIPPTVYEYRLGNRSALEWVIDQYRVSVDSRSGIENDPNRDDDPQYILRLIGQVITVSLATVEIVKSLPSMRFGDHTPGQP